MELDELHGEIGFCDFIDALEAAVVARRPMYVELDAGEHFVDLPIDVVTENGVDYAVFVSRGKIAVRSLHAVEDAGAKPRPARPRRPRAVIRRRR